MLRRLLSLRVLRFLIGGAANSGATYALYLLLARPIGDIAAFTTAYVLGIVFSYFINALFVFGVRPSLRSAVRFPWIYAMLYLLGLAMVWAFVGILQMPRAVAMLLIIVVNAAVSFFLIRFVLTPASNGAAMPGSGEG